MEWRNHMDGMYMPIPDDINACPICNSRDSVRITTPEDYQRQMDEHGWGSIFLECWKCNLELREHDLAGKATGDLQDYDAMRSKVVTKWNRLGGEQHA